MPTSPRQSSPAHHKRAARSVRPTDPLLELVVDEFLYACQQRLADDTLRSYRGVLRVFTTYLHEQLGRAPTLGDFTLTAVQRWAMGLQQRPKQERAGQAVGDHPVAIETRRTYLRTLRTFSNWLPSRRTLRAESPCATARRAPRTRSSFHLPTRRSRHCWQRRARS